MPTCDNISGVSDGFGEKVSREKIILRSTIRTPLGFHPDKVFDLSLLATDGACGRVELANLSFHLVHHFFGSFLESQEVEGGQRLPYNPEGHRVDICTDDTETKAGCLQYRGTTTGERVGNHTCHLMGTPVSRFKGLFAVEFRQKQATKDAAWPACEPFMNTDKGTIALLNLLFPLSEHRGKSYVEAIFQRHVLRYLMGLYYYT
jgi:hypothetical protein